MAVAVVAGLGAVGGSMAVAGTFAIGLTSALTAFAIGAGLSMISQALQPKLSLGQETGLSTSLSNPVAERPVIYGRIRTGGTIVYYTTSGAGNKYLHFVIAMAGHAIDGYEKIHFDDQVVWENGSYVDDWVQKAQINFFDGTQTTADTDLVNASSEWNSNCVLNDTAYIHVRLEYDAEVYSNGIPNITATMRGKKVYDPRTGTTAWSENPALCIYDYLKDDKYGLNDDTVNESQVIASANVCDQLVTIDTGVDQTRYALSAYINSGDTLKSNIEKMLSSMFGKLVCSGGELFVNAGYYTSPVLDIDESLLVGPVSLQTKSSKRNSYNAVKGVFLSEEENYILADYPSIKSDTYSVEDGEPIYLDLSLPCTTNNVRAQRLAKLSLNKSRQQRTLNIPVNLTGLKVMAGDVIRFTSDRLGISNAEYEVVDFEFNYTEQLIVNLICVETGSSLYDWTVSDKLDFSLSSDITLYDGTPVAPTNLAGVSGIVTDTDGISSAFIDISWTVSDDAYVDYYIIEYSNGNDTQSIRSNGTGHRITTYNERSVYTINVYSVNLTGRKSEAVTIDVISAVLPAIKLSHNEDFDYASINDLDWTDYVGTGELAIVSRVEAYNGKALQIGNNDSNDRKNIIYNKSFVYNPNKKYRIKARLRQTAGTGTVYIGVAGRNKADTEFVSKLGTNVSDSQFYCSASNHDIDNTWTEVVGYISGYDTDANNVGYAPNYYYPCPLHPDVFHVRPMIIVNYANEDGVTEIDYIRIEEVDQDPISYARLASGAFHIGGFGDIKLTVNNLYNGTANDGEIRVEGSTFYHPDTELPTASPNGGKYSITNNTGIYTPFEVEPEPNGGSIVQEVFFIIFSDEDVADRFTTLDFTTPASSTYAINFFIAIYDEYYKKWFAIDNYNDREEFTPERTDCIIGYGKKHDYANGIDSIITTFGGGGEFSFIDQITSSNSLSFLGSSTVDTNQVVANAITTAKIENAAITTAKIEDAAITTAKIGLAQVDTLELAGQAVTIPSGNFTSGTVTPSGETTIQQVTFTSTGAEVFINFTCICESFAVSGTSYSDLRLYRGSTLIQNFGQMAKMPYGNAMPLAVSIKDEPSAGAHTYYMKVGSYTGVRFKARSMTALEVKR